MERMNDQAKADQAQSLSDDEESERIRKMMEEDVVGRDKEKAGGGEENVDDDNDPVLSRTLCVSGWLRDAT